MFRYLLASVALVLILSGVLLTAPTPAHAQGGGGSGVGCYYPPRLSVGTNARVTFYPALSNRLRQTPGYGSSVVGRIPPGGVFYVYGDQTNPMCLQGMWWYHVNYEGRIGWTAEGYGPNNYWLEPYPYTHPPTSCTLTPRLRIGQHGQITPGLPNVIRTAPGTTASGANSVVIGSIPALGIFEVLAGPECGLDGRYWWQVNYNGTIGWTAEGEGSLYWTLPLTW